jgi:hypothetical protein
MDSIEQQIAPKMRKLAEEKKNPRPLRVGDCEIAFD